MEKATATAQMAESPLQRDINQHGEQLEKLTELVFILRSRLSPILNTQGADRADEGSKDESTSPFRGQINHQTEMVKNIGLTINTLLEQMEI